jgi:N-ethylmaleimide reductase
LIRKHYRGRLVLNGGYDKTRAQVDLALGRADLISFGKLFLANADLPEKLRRGDPLNEPDPTTFYGGGVRGYTDYP